MAELLIATHPELYADFAYTNAKGQLVLLVRLEKALYGIMQASLIFYQQLSRDLKQKGFKINPYDPCVANMDVDGSQLTVIWHVDDMKVSHVKSQVATDTIKWLQSLYLPSPGSDTKMQVSRGKVHTFLGMCFDYTHKGKVRISMAHFVKELIDEFPDAKRRNQQTLQRL